MKIVLVFLLILPLFQGEYCNARCSANSAAACHLSLMYTVATMATIIIVLSGC